MKSVLARAAKTSSNISFLRGRPTRYLVQLNNFFVRMKGQSSLAPSGLKELDNVKKRALLWSDINDHLVTLFTETLAAKPQLIVELGTRGGESTFALESVAQLFDAHLVCVDLEDCKHVLKYKRSHFFQSDDITFADKFQAWCQEQKIDPAIDVLFIDTSHEYEHTCQEIEKWFPFVASNGRVLLHDTNLKYLYDRRDGSIGTAWDNDRGVIAALEKHLDHSYDEQSDFVDCRGGWLIKHDATCNGFTILERVPIGR